MPPRADAAPKLGEPSKGRHSASNVRGCYHGEVDAARSVNTGHNSYTTPGFQESATIYLFSSFTTSVVQEPISDQRTPSRRQPVCQRQLSAALHRQHSSERALHLHYIHLSSWPTESRRQRQHHSNKQPSRAKASWRLGQDHRIYRSHPRVSRA